MASSSWSAGVPAPSEYRFSPIGPDDHAGLLWIATLFSAVFAILSAAAWIYIKRHHFGVDDWFCVAGTVFGTVIFLIIAVALQQGLGKLPSSVGAEHLHDVEVSVFVSWIVWVVALGLAKCSVVALIRRLFAEDMTRERYLCTVVSTIIALWGLGSIVALSIACDPGGALPQHGGRCSNQLTRWAFIGVLDATSELLVFLLSFSLIWGRQMPRDRKFRVILAFVFRLPLVAIAVVHIVLIRSSTDFSNSNLVIVPAIICEQIELCYSLCSATIPNLKSFISNFDTAMMMQVKYLPSPPQHPLLHLSEGHSSASQKPQQSSNLDSTDAFVLQLRLDKTLKSGRMGFVSLD